MENEVEVLSTGSVMQATFGAEVDSQVSTAKRFPRNVPKFLKTVESTVLSSPSVAEECFYHLERDDKRNNKKVIIEGPSIRFAEVISSAWGNLRIDSGVADIGEKYVTTYGACWDLENNVAERFTTKKRITYKSGQRYSEDMAEKAAGAARSIAKREAILKTIPKVLWEPVFEKALQAARGSSVDMPIRRQQMVNYYSKIGVTIEQLLWKIGKASLDQLDAEDLFRLKGIATALKEGDTTIDEAFPRTGGTEPDAQTSELLNKIKTEAAKTVTTSESTTKAESEVKQSVEPTQKNASPKQHEPQGLLSKALDEKLKTTHKEL